MSSQPSAPAPKTETPVPPLPAWLPEDLIPLYLWVREKGVQAAVIVLIGLILSGAAFMYLRHRAGLSAQASEQLAAADTIEALEATVQQCGGTTAGVSVSLRLARAYYDGGRYDEALATYDGFLRKHADHPFADIAAVGRAYALSALDRQDEALAAFRAFQEKNPKSYLLPQVVLGEATCLAATGKKPDARALLEALRAAHRDTSWDVLAKRLEGVIDRYDGRGARSLFDQANTLAPPAPLTISGGGTNPVIVK